MGDRHPRRDHQGASRLIKPLAIYHGIRYEMRTLSLVMLYGWQASSESSHTFKPEG